MRHLILYLSDKSVSALLVKLVHTRGVQNACNLTPELVAWLVASVFVRSTLHNVGNWWYRRPSIGQHSRITLCVALTVRAAAAALTAPFSSATTVIVTSISSFSRAIVGTS
jgi:hypothetical protein